MSASLFWNILFMKLLLYFSISCSFMFSFKVLFMNFIASSFLSNTVLNMASCSCQLVNWYCSFWSESVSWFSFVSCVLCDSNIIASCCFSCCFAHFFSNIWLYFIYSLYVNVSILVHLLNYNIYSSFCQYLFCSKFFCFVNSFVFIFNFFCFLVFILFITILINFIFFLLYFWFLVWILS